MATKTQALREVIQRGAIAQFNHVLDLRAQSQESVIDQLLELRNIANVVGLYDAADWIEENLNE